MKRTRLKWLSNRSRWIRKSKQHAWGADQGCLRRLPLRSLRSLRYTKGNCFVNASHIYLLVSLISILLYSVCPSFLSYSSITWCLSSIIQVPHASSLLCRSSGQLPFPQRRSTSMVRHKYLPYTSCQFPYCRSRWL
jgi:hypothetical protein